MLTNIINIYIYIIKYNIYIYNKYIYIYIIYIYNIYIYNIYIYNIYIYIYVLVHQFSCVYLSENGLSFAGHIKIRDNY